MLGVSKPPVSQLTKLLESRLASQQGSNFLDGASEIIIFGSVAATVDKPDSDLDVMVVTAHGKSFKSENLDIVGVPLASRNSVEWMTSELASHVREYGIWLSGSPAWGECGISQRAIDAKARRIRSFLRSLPQAWHKFDSIFKMKYATKLRRETQRLILLECKVPIPPTRLLDEEWDKRFGTQEGILDRLEKLNVNQDNVVFEELCGRILQHFAKAK